MYLYAYLRRVCGVVFTVWPSSRLSLTAQNASSKQTNKTNVKTFNGFWWVFYDLIGVFSLSQFSVNEYIFSAFPVHVQPAEENNCRDGCFTVPLFTQKLKWLKSPLHRRVIYGSGVEMRRSGSSNHSSSMLFLCFRARQRRRHSSEWSLFGSALPRNQFKDEIASFTISITN